MTDKQNGWHYVVTRFCYPRYKKYLGENMEILLMIIVGIIGFALDGATERKN